MYLCGVGKWKVNINDKAHKLQELNIEISEPGKMDFKISFTTMKYNGNDHGPLLFG